MLEVNFGDDRSVRKTLLQAFGCYFKLYCWGSSAVAERISKTLIIY